MGGGVEVFVDGAEVFVGGGARVAVKAGDYVGFGGAVAGLAVDALFAPAAAGKEGAGGGVVVVDVGVSNGVGLLYEKCGAAADPSGTYGGGGSPGYGVSVLGGSGFEVADV